MYKKYYSQFLTANPHIQHYASHSHHFWPDVTRVATLQYWDDSAKLVDDKWGYIFGKKIPATQKLIAEILNVSAPEQIVFAPNTHELVYRLFSCFDPKKTISVLTTDSEFYSFDRQVNRLVEEKVVSVEKITTHPFDDFEARFIKKIQENHYDMIFLSHVFFNSGMVVRNLEKIVTAVTETNTMIVIDGYHGFMAVPTDLKMIEDRIFYIAGSYKYAQGGEGCCFMVTPKDSCLRPLYTGWFAGFDALETDGGNTGYSRDGYRFAGSTMDFSALYRLEAVLSLFKKEGLTVEKIHAHVQKLQKNFRDHLLEIDHHYLTEKNILSVNYNHHGHFLTFAMPSAEHAKALHDELRAINVWTDYRASRLRFGFAIYQNDCIDLKALVKTL
jgi:selenocysteine lyase/cysteine desulfurase